MRSQPWRVEPGIGAACSGRGCGAKPEARTAAGCSNHRIVGDLPLPNMEAMMLRRNTAGQTDFWSEASLPGLATALDGDRMTEIFPQHLWALGLDRDWRVARCAIEKIYYRPHKRCGILYRLHFHHPSQAETNEWLYGEILPKDDALKHFKKLPARPGLNQSACACLRTLPAASLWQDFNMILWIFPHDPVMTTLARVVAPAAVAAEVEAHLPAFGLSPAAAWRVTATSCDRIKLLPGKRCVLRHHVRLAAPAGATRELTFYSKTYGAGKTRSRFVSLAAAHEHLTCGTGAINIPRPLFYLEESDSYWQEEWPGQALVEVLAEQNWRELMPRLAGVVADVHQKRINGLASAPTLDGIYREVTQDAAKLAKLLPPLAGLMAACSACLRAHKETLEAQEAPVTPIHGACRIEQFLIRGQELALIDFDALALGDPLADVAEFIASLQYLELSRDFSHAAVTTALTEFHESYAARAPWPCDRRRLAWYALSFFLTKLYAATKNCDRRALQKLNTAGREICAGWLAMMETRT